jgi:regulator of protease activity HflC (stomatin/prohibitin superfamily)
MMHVHLRLHERAILIRDGQPARALGPGRYTLWRRHDVQRFDTDALTFTAPPAVVAAMPADWFETVRLAPGQYGVIFRDDGAVAFLRPGVHRMWRVDGNVTFRAFADREPLPELTDELRKTIPAGELLEATLELHQRAVLLRGGAPERVLEPGHHAFWGRHTKLVTWSIDDPVFAAPPDVLAALPATWYTTVQLGAMQRAVVLRDARPVKFLRPGVHRIWTIHPSVAVEIFDVSAAPPELTDELRAVIPAGELVEAQVKQFERGLKYAQGKFEGILEPGRYAYWNHPGARIAVQVLDTRVQQLKIEGQELMTKDKVTLRLTLTAEYAPADAATTVHAVADVKEALYLAVQLAAIEFVLMAKPEGQFVGSRSKRQQVREDAARSFDKEGILVGPVGKQ